MEGKFRKFALKFESVVYLEVTSLELYQDFDDDLYETSSSFDEILNSKLIEELGKHDPNREVSEDHRHYVLATYDDVFEIVARDVTLELGDYE